MKKICLEAPKEIPEIGGKAESEKRAAVQRIYEPEWMFAVGLDQYKGQTSLFY